MNRIKIHENGQVSEYSLKDLAHMARQLARDCPVKHARVQGWDIDILEGGRVRLHVTIEGGEVGAIL